MSKYIVDITPEDIGEIIQMIRIQHFKMHVDPFAEKIGVKSKVVIQAEEGEKKESKEISFNNIRVISRSNKLEEESGEESFVPKTKAEPKSAKQVLAKMDDNDDLPFN